MENCQECVILKITGMNYRAIYKNPFLKEKLREHLPQKKKCITLSLLSLTHYFIYIKVTILFKILHFSTLDSFPKFLLEV